MRNIEKSKRGRQELRTIQEYKERTRAYKKRKLKQKITVWSESGRIYDEMATCCILAVSFSIYSSSWNGEHATVLTSSIKYKTVTTFHMYQKIKTFNEEQIHE